MVPSISAITGISPGRYIWRMAVAFHLGPRIFILSTYYHYLLSFIGPVSRSCVANGRNQSADAAPVSSEDPARSLTKLLKMVYYLQILEIIGLCGISFIHNRENYRKNTDRPCKLAIAFSFVVCLLFQPSIQTVSFSTSRRLISPFCSSSRYITSFGRTLARRSEIPTTKS